MKRFFFDFTTNEHSLYDYSGDEFASPQSAIEFAHATAQVLKHSLSGDWVGWSIVVRNAEGEKFFSLSVGTPETIAA